MHEKLTGRVAAPANGAVAWRLRLAELKARGTIGGIARCGRAGLLSQESLRELNDAYLYRVELLLEAASLLHHSAMTVRELID